ncbi:conserved hypothetical protein [Pediculus humanus corporis]|uniref:D-aminoacyl-tRNA deacylase n=1 Tax=Pediculus humanus subsp. corporis TaxID=121224 RepID=E0W3X0_PEDHC|nr:uncharacterized protein Phum_PHUM612080 [Pediculus humanus corporis]EEB20326.1 conserved hypothetical protein [Pediculus humanus corporis]
MKIVIQRVTHSSVKVNDEIISSIGRGLLVLIGIGREDTQEDVNYALSQCHTLYFSDKSVMDKQYEVMCVSQFTLCNSLKGNKLDFHHAMKPDESQKFYEHILERLKCQYDPDKIKEGMFGALMQVELCNDGPVTISLSSNKGEKEKNVESTES